MRTLRLATTTLALFSFVLGACKEDEVDIDDYVNSYSTQVCDAVIECNCDYPGGAQLEHCMAQLSVGAKTQAELLDVEGLTFDGACAEQQISDISRLGCGVFMEDPDAECEAPCKAWYGPMHAGGTCTSINGFDNCNQGLTCRQGVCVHPCAEPDLPQLGESCAPEFGCDEGLWCDVLSDPLLPVCATLPELGEPCLPDQFGYACGEELVCDLSDPDAPVCAALPGLDEPCPAGACADDLYCDNSAAPAVCTMLPELGEVCPVGLCAAPNQCEDGLCVEPRPQVCGFYGGVPEGLGDGDGGGDGITAGDATGVGETGFGETGVGETGFGETGFGETGFGETGSVSDCCIPHETPGCDDIAVATCVCELEPTCCAEPWSSACVEVAVINECGLTC